MRHAGFQTVKKMIQLLKVRIVVDKFDLSLITK